MRVRPLFTLLALLLSITVNAATYYFSTSDGDDSRSFTEAQDPSTPWQSIDKLNAIFRNLQPGDSVLFKSGDIFYGAIVTNQSGSSSSPIVLSSYGAGPQPVISGFINLSVWVPVGNGIYGSGDLPTGNQVNMVLISGKEYAMGRYPNISDGNSGYLNFESHGYNYISDNENPLSSSWKGAQLVVRTNRYTLEQSTITDVSGNTISYSPSLRTSARDKFGYFVQNSIQTLDQFGEWYYNPQIHRLFMYFGDKDPAFNRVQVAYEDILLTVQNSNIVVDNLSFTGANKYAIWGDWAGVSNLQVKNCSINFSGVDGIALANRRDFLLDNTTITNTNSVGVSLYYKNSNPVVRNCTIRNSGTFAGMLQRDPAAKYAAGIVSSAGLTATNNQVINSGWMGIMFFGSNNLIQNNLVDTFATVVDDAGGIYTGVYIQPGLRPPYVYNRKVIGNIVLHGIGAKDGAWDTNPNYFPANGIFLDNDATNVDIENNTAAFCTNHGIYMHNSEDYTVIGNVLYSNDYAQLGFAHDEVGISLSGGLILRNQMYSPLATQYILRFGSTENDVANVGSFDSNYYCRPSDEEQIINSIWFSHDQNKYDLPGWQSAFNRDLHTKKTPVPVSDPNNVLFLYNASTSDTTIKLGGTYVSVTGDRYSGKVTLAPYTSIILLQANNGNNANASASSMSANAAAMTNTAVAAPGYVHTEPATLVVKAYPNPSSQYFNVTAQGGSTTEPMTLRITDLSGRLLQIRTDITANSTLQIGQDLAAGSYVLELIQGNKKVEQKIIKLPK